ncbi:MAG: Electron transfer flavoprotein subunit alpha [Dehalococcoidia bacterium]|nr:Electron transfer flavoprotein subunit alpha [Dehalococcoidia bacterium]
MANGAGVLIVGEVAGRELAGITGELLGVGRKLANARGEELLAVFLGSGIGATAAGAFAQGADKVYVVDNSLLASYQPESYAAAMERVCAELTPGILLMGATYMGRDLAPKLACRLKTGLATDCVALNIDPQTRGMLATRAAYGAKAMAEVDCGTVRPAMASVKTKSQEPLEPDSSRRGAVVPIAVQLNAALAKTQVVNRVTVEVKGIRLEDARIVVGGGRGLGSIANWKSLEALAADLKGAVGSTRGACDEGYCEMATQLGITAKSIAPELYIAVGISGASQHMGGVSFSKHIVCINKDAESPVFKLSQYGVVGKWEDVLPAFHRKVKELLAG